MESTNLHEGDEIQLWQQFVECPFAAQSAAGYGVSSSITPNFSPNMQCWRSDKDNNILPNHPEILQNLTSRPKDIEAALPVAPAAAFNHDLGFGDAILRRSFAINESTSFLQLGKSNLNPSASIKHEKREGLSWLNPLSCSGRTGSRLLDLSAAAAAAGEFHSSSKAASDPDHRLDDGEALFSSSKFGQVLPSTYANQDPSLLVTSSVGMYRQALDPLISTRNLGHQAHMQEPSCSPSSSSNNKASNNRNGVPKVKRSGCSSEPKASISPARKSRTIFKTPYTPLKVRKEKLGDRISALHRLVAPFGKTDTASVLTETIGYIQFLEDQIQTFCAPYIKASLGKPCVIIQKSSRMKGGKQQQDLRSRGLCLVPICFTSYISFHSH
ncbi:transcription factor bHLH113-like [Diospyros lotus]|uniref:transcription factor bHLH113-like n=1 Tax=Diospyros lotus TaxID=55363 RepID=UPI0022509477|nr:transcription factor bHLH113-like [Diospyros lotus]